ncbi:Sensors of blue-light using FAD family protein [Acinetobacter nosocomialis]|nr:Sensors of blue-light using FAD family protein [Acinetobacter nosocomialis]
MNVRLCYASQRNENNEDLLQDLRDILTEARDFNDLNEICGVLYYADNAFFQCLEGLCCTNLAYKVYSVL